MVEEAKWKPVTEGVGQLLSMKDGVAIIKAFDQGANGKWKWAKSPGDGRTRAFFACNNHTTCAASAGKLMRCVQQGGIFVLQEKGDHGSDLSPFKRKNSVLTWDEEKSMTFALSTGGKPGALHTVFTTDAAQVLEDAGEDPLLHKRSEGGLEEVCTLGQLQRKVKYAKVVKGGNIQVQNMLEMGQLIQPLLMPPQVCDLVPAAAGALGVPVRDILYIPMDAASFDVHGACFTGPMQIQWIGQLCGLDYCFVLHIDGKHKLHHGKWLLITLGTHCLNWNKHHNALGNTFNPLIYMFCKEHETLGSGQLICASLNKVALQYFGKKLVPGAGCTDHCQSFRRAMVEEWPTIQFGQCYPHIARKFGEGAYCKKTWKHMGEVQLDIRAINLAGTKDMKALLLGVIGADWDLKGKTMDKFWYSNCVEPWDCWSICDLECMLATPSNQTQESWHKQLILKKIPGMFKASTAFVINTTLPLLAKIDGLSMSSKLQFEVETLPRDMVIKAMWYVDHKSTHFYTAKDRNGDIFYYFLAKANPGGFKKIGKINLAAYVDACQGIRHASCHTKERLIHFCQSFHFLYEFNDDTYSLPVCHWNPGNFTCPTCKGFKHVGICSHVLATNHILELIDLDYLMGALCKPRKKGGQTQKPRPALQREADSSECSTPPESDDEVPRID